MRILPWNWCIFCHRRSKIKMGCGTSFCINGHIVIKFDGTRVMSQPRSHGTDMCGTNVYRLHTTHGEFCDKDGNII